MGLIFALIVIGILTYILSRQNKSETIIQNNNSVLYKVLTITTIGLAIVQAPLFYYPNLCN